MRIIKYILCLFLLFLGRLYSQQWGVAQVSKPNTSIYFASKPICKFIAYNISNFKGQSMVEFGPISRTDRSPVFGADGKPWEWMASNVKIDKAEVPSFWLCVPSNWRLEPLDDLHARIFINERPVGSIAIQMATEGFWVSIDYQERIEKGYFSLGYELSPVGQ